MSESKSRLNIQKQIFYHFKNKAKNWIKLHPLEKAFNFSNNNILFNENHSTIDMNMIPIMIEEGIQFEMISDHTTDDEKCKKWVLVLNTESNFPVSLHFVTSYKSYHYYLFSNNQEFRIIDLKKDRYYLKRKKFPDTRVIELLKSIFNIHYNVQENIFSISDYKELLHETIKEIKNGS